MNVGKFAVTRPVAVTMRIAALVLLGFICLLRLPVDLLPKVDIPTVAVNVNWPNTSPEEMEARIARPLEQSLSTVRGLYLVSTTASQGSVFVRAQFNYGVDVDKASIDVFQQVQRAQGRFPNDPNISSPTIFKFDPSTQPILIYGVVPANGDLVKLRERMNNELSPQIEAAGGVASVTISGSQDRAILVEITPEKLRAYNLTLADVSRKLQSENLALPAGSAIQGKTRYNLRSYGYFKSLDDLRKVPISTVNGKPITLAEVATVRDATPEITSYTRLDSKPAVVLSVTKQSDANTIETSRAVQDVLRSIESRNPDLKFNLIYDQAGFVERSIDDLKETAVIGGVLAVIIITFFLRNLRSTFVVALSIPISIVSTFSLLYFCGYTLNSISLSGLALATGLIVDDAIVVLENIYRHIEKDNMRAAEAAVKGTQEILSAVLASTFTVMIVFLPLLLIKGQSGQVFTQFAMVVIFSIAVSLLDATTIVPMLAARMISEKEVREEFHPELRTGKVSLLVRAFDKVGARIDRLDHAYRRTLTWVLPRRWWVIGLGILTLGAAGLIWPLVGKEQFPATDSGNINVRLKLPIGTTLEKTDATMRTVEAILAKDPDVDTILAGAGANIGLRGSGGAPPQEGSATIRLKANRKSSTADVVKRLQRSFGSIAGARVQVSTLDVVQNVLGANTGFSIDVYGTDLEELTKAARSAQAAISDIPGLQNVDLQVQDALPEIRWEIDRTQSGVLGVDFADVAATINAATTGQLSSYYQEKGFQIPIYVQVPFERRQSLDDLRNLPITNGRTEPAITLGQVANAKFDVGPNQITRQNRQRMINVGGQLLDRPESEVQADVEKALSKVSFPTGTYWQFGVNQQQKAKEYSGLGLAVVLAIALIYMLLATQFESFVFPIVVLVSAPLCVIGLVLALFLTGRSFGLTAFIGLLMLIGIVVKNGILLVEATNQMRAEGVPRDEALLRAGPNRLRPILMTTLSAILGMMPLALSLGSGSELYVPLATAVIGGLISSTLLTLLIVPAVYVVVDDLVTKGKGGQPMDLAPALGVEPTVGAVASREVSE
ncbi:MAG: efflux RND transporter permease subunit [Armatimonadetes bacterium]|nr:efflux RND transporter permease subunit [Armatimonadota bacterium]